MSSSHAIYRRQAPLSRGSQAPEFAKLKYFLAFPRHKTKRVESLRNIVNEAAARGEVQLTTSSFREEIAQQLMAVLCDIVPRYERSWTERDVPRRIEADGEHRCFGVEQPVRAVARFSVLCGHDVPDVRILASCPRCGLTEVRDVSLQVYVRATRDARLELVTEGEYEDLRLKLVVVGQGDKYRERSIHSWPTAEDGNFERIVEPPPIMFPGMVHLVAIVIADGLFSTFSFAVPGSRHASRELSLDEGGPPGGQTESREA